LRSGFLQRKNPVFPVLGFCCEVLELCDAAIISLCRRSRQDRDLANRQQRELDLIVSNIKP
jgi:hypothetical protein